ncbi:MAG: RNA polymerase sigma factor, partial [Leptospiraceae bacterium]|nr:RNA polymerase sigma factor [Leptospiraceae bacterium]
LETKKYVLSAIRTYIQVEYLDYIDDIAQETYLRAYKALMQGKFKEESKLSTWIYSIAKNETIRLNQKMNREFKKTERLKEEVREEIEENYSTFSLLGLKSIWKEVPIKYREVLSLSYKGKTEKEIAGTLSIQKGTVKSRMHRGKEILQRLLGRSK